MQIPDDEARVLMESYIRDPKGTEKRLREHAPTVTRDVKYVSGAALNAKASRKAKAPRAKAAPKRAAASKKKAAVARKPARAAAGGASKRRAPARAR